MCVWGGGELRREKGVGGGWLIRGESVCVRDKSCERGSRLYVVLTDTT